MKLDEETGSFGLVLMSLIAFSDAAIRSEGAVHSHTRRALAAGATREEVQHAVIVATSTIGFPNVMAALSWIHDVTGRRGR